MKDEQQQGIVHRGVTFGVVTFLVAATILTGVGSVATTVQTTNPEDENRQRRWKRLRGCFAYLTKRSSALPLWKSLLIKSMVTFITTLGAAIISIVISNVMATDKETIRETVAAILDIDLGGARRRRSAGHFEDSGQGLTTALCCALGRDSDQVHCMLVILAVLVFVMAIVTPVFVVLAMRLHTKIQEARGRRKTQTLGENDDDIEEQ